MERHLRDNYLPRASADIQPSNDMTGNITKCMKELMPFLREDRYKKTFPSR